MKLYRITPEHKKSVEYFIDVYEERSDGTVRGFDATFCYRWGQAFRDEDNPPSKNEAEQSVIWAKTDVGYGCEFDDLCAVHVKFGDGFTEEEKAEIEALCNGESSDEDGRWGESWIFDGDHNWQIEEDAVYIISPFRIDLVSEDGVVLEENVELE
jgi:hypothetical protein